MRRFALASVSLAALLAGCSGSESLNGPRPTVLPNPSLGRTAFEGQCAQCHASKDGFDLAFFGFSDTTIIRRAVAHVDTTTARHIVAYIRSLGSPVRDENLRLFQPGAAPMASDQAFAVALFGRDAWPAELTTAALSGIDARRTSIAMRMPVWSDEGSNLDWMPDQPLPPEILDYNGGLAAGAVAGYRAVPTRENLLRAVNALRAADRAPGNPGAPCLLEDSARVNYRVCFEVRRWTSSLVALHLLRTGVDVNLGGALHDVWWDVGNAARKSRADRSVPVANPVENWASWMFLGWSFDPSRHPSVYTGGGFRQLGLVRHATFIALKSQVSRPKHSPSVYDDLLNAVRFSPSGWTTSATTFGLRHLLERLQAGDRPQRSEQITMAAAAVSSALTEAGRKVPVADRAGLQTLALQVLEALGQ